MTTPVYDDTVTWADAVDLGIEALAHIDKGRWVLGDCAILIQAHYGENEIGRYADEVNIDVKRVQEYRTCAKYYPAQIRAQFEGLPVTYSHFRAAMRLNDLEASLDMLHESATEQWRVLDLQKAIDAAQGKQAPQPPITLTLVFDDQGVVTVTGGDGAGIVPGEAYRAVLTAV